MRRVKEWSACSQPSTLPSGALITALYPPDPTPQAPSPIGQFQQWPTTAASDASNGDPSIQFTKRPTAVQGAIIALGIICGLLICINLFMVCMYCLGRSLQHDTRQDSPTAMASTRPRKSNGRSRPKSHRSEFPNTRSPVPLVNGLEAGSFRPDRASLSSLQPAYVAHNRGRPMQHANASVEDPTDASVAGSSKFEEMQRHGHRALVGSDESLASSRTVFHRHGKE